MPIILDIYIENERDGEEDHYVERAWNVLPDVGDTIVHTTATDDGEISVWEGIVKRRLFVTDDEKTLRVQLHCEAGNVFERPAPREQAAPVDTL